MRERPDAICSAIAAHQFGLITRQQALDAGMSPDAIKRRLAWNQWQKILPGVYRLDGVPRAWDQRAKGATLWAGEGSAISHSSAGALLRLDGCVRGKLHLSTPRSLRSPSRELLIHAAHLEPDEITLISSIPVTSPTRTLVDLGAVMEADLVERALEDALRKRLTSIDELRTAASRLEGRKKWGANTLRSLLSERDNSYRPVESELERRFASLIRRHGIEPPVTQHVVTDGGRFVARVDFAYPALMLAIEIDGFEAHSGRAAWHSDRTRLNELIALGWRVLHITWPQLRDNPSAVADTLRTALAA